MKEIRRDLDQAITYADMQKARRLAAKGLKMAREQEALGDIMYFRAQQEILAEHFREAIRYLDLAVRFNPSDGAAYNDRALCMTELGLFSEAFPYFDKGIKAEPDYATVYHNKGWLLNRLGRHQEAIPYFEKALALEPDRAVTFENLADAYQHLGRIREAREAYQKSLALLSDTHPDIRAQIEESIKKLEKREHAG